MADTDELEIEVAEPEAPPEDDVEVVEAKPEAKQEVTPEQGVEVLKAQLENEKAARQAEANARLQAEREAHTARGQVQDTNVQLVTNAISQVDQATEMLQGQYAEALSAQDYASAAKIQTELATNAARKLQLENGLEAMKAQKVAPPPQRSDPVEALAAQLSPQSAQWVRQHPEYATDQRLFQRMLAAHNLAVTDGIAPDTDDYFRSIEGTLGMTQRQQQQAQPQPAPQPARRAAPAAAPVGRGANGSSQNPNRVTLSREEVEMAEMMGMTPEEYGRNKLALKREGKLN